MMRCCDSCKHMDGRDWRTIPPRGEIPEITVRSGHCRAMPPRAFNATQSGFPVVHLGWSCGVHSFSWAGFWRAVRRAINREN